MESKKLTAEEIAKAKAKGFLQNRGTNNFNGRIITKNGVLTAKELSVAAAAAEKFGNGKVTFTMRQTVEVVGISYENIEPFCKYIETNAQLKTGGTGAKVRPVVSCKGTTCIYGLADTQAIALSIHNTFYEGMGKEALPHKVKIAVGGCPNNCAKVDLNDIGFMAQRVVDFEPSNCKNCKNCGVITECPMGCPTIVEEKISIDKTKCNNCGRCTAKCPFGVTKNYKDMVKIHIGGRWGKQIRMGTPLNSLYTYEEGIELAKQIIKVYQKVGLPKERLASTIERIGIKDFESMLG